MTVTKKDLMERSASLKKKIDSGKLKGASLKRARYAYYNANYRASLKTEAAKSTKKNTSKVRASKVDPKQMFLTGFLSGEGISEIFQKRLNDRIDQIVERHVEKLLKANG